MIKVNLSKYKLPKVYKRNGIDCVFDPCRQKLIPLTPEEEVRQKMIMFLQDTLQMPLQYTFTEEPLKEGKRVVGRIDILVDLRSPKLEAPIAFLVVECKAWGVPLTDVVYEQVYSYAQHLVACSFAMTNGTQLEYYTWDEDAERYVHTDIMHGWGEGVEVKLEKEPYDDWKRPAFKSLNKPKVYKESFLKYGLIGEKTPDEFRHFIMNLAGCLQDNTVSYERPKISEYTVERTGMRFASFGSASGNTWTSLFRYFVIQDPSGNNQIFSCVVMGSDNGFTYLSMAIDDFDKSHNSLQLRMDTYVSITGNTASIWHDGAMAVGRSGSAKRSEVIEYIRKKAPELLKQGRIHLGSFDCRKEITINDSETEDLIGRVIKYSILRDELRAQIKARKK